MHSDFEVAACHGDHAGKAHLSVRDRQGGAEIAIHHMPFDADLNESLGEEQARILALAAGIARAAAEFLEAAATEVRAWPTHSPKLGPSPRQGEAPNAFGHPLSRD
jgi:hypothetical protein